MSITTTTTTIDMPFGRPRLLPCLLLVSFAVIFLLLIVDKCPLIDEIAPKKLSIIANDSTVRVGHFDSKSPIVFIGGVPRSGTTLMRALLDAHPDIRCGEETRVIPRILGLRAQWRRNKKEAKRLYEAGVNDSVLNAAVSAFILEVIAGHGESAKHLCNKDPFTLKSTQYLIELFPNSKFILVVRDGRATVHSIISRKVTITGFDLSDYRQCLEMWNKAMMAMHLQCYNAGPTRCFMIHYEQLVLHPEQQMRQLLRFLDIPWNQSVLHHESFIGKQISVSSVERSTDQVVKPINLDALTKWVGNIPDDVLKEMGFIAPMLQKLGYDPYANPPVYGQPDEVVRRQTNEIHENGQIWYEKAAKLVDDSSQVEPPAPPVR